MDLFCGLLLTNELIPIQRSQQLNVKSTPTDVQISMKMHIKPALGVELMYQSISLPRPLPQRSCVAKVKECGYSFLKGIKILVVLCKLFLSP